MWAGTAAPVLALANLVTVGDAVGRNPSLARARRTPGENRNFAAFGYVVNRTLYWASALTMLLQGLVLILALASFAIGRDAGPLLMALLIEGLAFVVLLFTTLWGVTAKEVEKFVTSNASPTPPLATQAPPSPEDPAAPAPEDSQTHGPADPAEAE